MNARIATATTIAVVFAGVLPARAADPQLLGLVMPDAQVLAGVNVDQAKATPFGQYVLSQIQTGDPKFQELINLTGFDPTRDVREVLVASNAVAGKHSGLMVARGMFDPARILSAATSHGAVTETVSGVTIIEEPQKTNGIAFLDSTIVVAGDLANVKAAIARQSAPSTLPAALSTQVSQWSNSQDAWAISAVPLSTLHPPASAPQVPGLNGQGTFQAVQSAAGGVKFGALIVASAQVTADTAQNAQAMGDALKMLANLAQLQSAQNPVVGALVQSLKVSSNGTVLNASVSLPEDQFEQVIKTPHQQMGPRGARPMRKQ
jgi:hypothetical protein